MSDPTMHIDLPEHVGEDTVVEIQERVAEATRATGGPPTGLFARREIKKGELLYGLDQVPSAIYMLRTGTMRLRVPVSRSVSAMPVTTLYHAAPNAGQNRPILGARYFFDRRRVTLEYVAETPCSVYEIGSKSLETLRELDEGSIVLMMYWLMVSSDVSEAFLPVVSNALGLEKPSVGDTQGLLRAVEEFRAARNDPRMPKLLLQIYERFRDRRRARAADLGLDASIA
jgi:hypothetical protein